MRLQFCWPVFVLALTACGGREELQSQLDASRGDARSPIGEQDALSGGDNSDGSTVGARVLPTLDVYCSTQQCVREWSSAEKSETWCALGVNAFLIHDCLGYDIAIHGGADTATAYVYNRADGKLVAIAQFGPVLGLEAGDLPFTDITTCLEGMPLDKNLCVPETDASSE